MNKTIAIVLFSVIILGFAGCSSNQGDNTPVDKIPEDFSVCFSWWYTKDRKNIMDTAEGRLQKDLILDGTATAEFQPDSDLLQRLYDLVCKGNLLDIQREMTSSELATGDTLMALEPNVHYEIAVRMNGKQVLICGDQTASGYTDTDEEASCFISTVDELLKMARDIPEWKALPEANGAYE